MNDRHFFPVVTVTLNPAVDQTVLVPGFTLDTVNRVEREITDPGGKGVNVSSYLSDFGIKTAATGLLGRDNIRLFERFFESKDIADRFVRIDGATRTNIKIVDEPGQRITDLNYTGAGCGPEHLEALLATCGELAAEGVWFVLAGSLPGGAPKSIYADITRAVLAAGSRVMLDTSGAALSASLETCPTAIKPNIDELRELTGRPLTRTGDIVGAARELNRQGIEHVIVSMGADGALFVPAHQEPIRVIPPKVELKSTVGAGDAMVAGFVYAQLRNEDPAEAARTASAFSVAAVTQFGPRLPSPNRVLGYRTQVRIEKAS